MTNDQQVVGRGEGTSYDWGNDNIVVKTPATLTNGAVTVVEDTLKPGFHLARHQHKLMTEIFYILDGAVQFAFDDHTVIATVGMTINVSPGVHHEVSCPEGGRLITAFTPGGFDTYLAEMAQLMEQGAGDAETFARLGERFDVWPG